MQHPEWFQPKEPQRDPLPRKLTLGRSGRCPSRTLPLRQLSALMASVFQWFQESE